jgi:membrane fusion protein, multidrug efflux system
MKRGKEMKATNRRGFFGPQKQAYTRLPALLALLTFVLIISGCDKQTTDEPPPPLAVRVTEVQEMTLIERAGYIGSVRSSKEIKVLAQIPGAISSIPLAEGERAEQGEPLVIIYAPDLDARLSRVQAETRRAQTDRDYLCDRYRTDERLTEAGALQQAALDASRRSCQGAEQGLKAARASLVELKANLAKAVERAPFEGSVLQWFAEPGENVGPGKPLLLFGGDELEIKVNVSEVDIARGIKVGTKVILHLSTSPEEANRSDSLTAEVAAVSPLALGPGRTIEVRIKIPDNARLVKHGTSVKVDFVIREKKSAMALPDQAIKHTAGGMVAYVIENNQAREVIVSEGISDGSRIDGGNNFRAGQLVATTNLDELSNGLSVYPVEIKGGTQ